MNNEMRKKLDEQQKLVMQIYADVKDVALDNAMQGELTDDKELYFDAFTTGARIVAKTIVKAIEKEKHYTDFSGKERR